ncbi:probable polyamine oxidase 2 [Tanacetum coccineum]
MVSIAIVGDMQLIAKGQAHLELSVRNTSEVPASLIEDKKQEFRATVQGAHTFSNEYMGSRPGKAASMSVTSVSQFYFPRCDVDFPRVTIINRRKNGVKVTVENETSFFADAAVIAMPLGERRYYRNEDQEKEKLRNIFPLIALLEQNPDTYKPPVGKQHVTCQGAWKIGTYEINAKWCDSNCGHIADAGLGQDGDTIGRECKLLLV